MTTDPTVPTDPTEPRKVVITQQQFDEAWAVATAESQGKLFLLRLLLMTELNLIGSR